MYISRHKQTMSPAMLQCVLHSLLTLVQTASVAQKPHLWLHSSLALWREEVKPWIMEVITHLENSVGKQKEALGKLATFVLIDILEHERSYFLQQCVASEDGLQAKVKEFTFQMPKATSQVLR
jgi:hypothetical protein